MRRAARGRRAYPRPMSRSARWMLIGLYLVAAVAMAVVFAIVTSGCRPAEPPPDALPSEHYAADWGRPLDPARRTTPPSRCAGPCARATLSP